MDGENNLNLKALVVDDNEVNTMILTNMLEVFDIHTDQADNGMTAAIMTGKMAYDLIFIDHIMPDMNGAQTTAAIRNLSSGQSKPIIIALTSDLTEQMKSIYMEAGANDIYAKPIGLLDIIKIIKCWFPDAKLGEVPVEKGIPANDKNEMIKNLVNAIEDIDYSTGLHYALGNPIHYINILEVSLKDLQSCSNIIVNSYKNNSIEQMRIGVHNLKSVLANIGAGMLSKKASEYEKIIMQGDIHQIDLNYTGFMRPLEHFKEQLKTSLGTYLAAIASEQENKEQAYIPMSNEEYEQCLQSTIYYIKRYEYDSIIKQIELLICRGRSEYRRELETALMNIKEFQYEKALEHLLKIKKETA